MARKNRFASPDYPHHVVNRGNERRTIFRDATDYLMFLDLLRERTRRYAVRIYSYCLMPNHFHLIAQPDTEGALSDFMESVTGDYACGLRRKTQTVGHGHVFQHRFWNAGIADDEAFYAVMRYVEDNARRAHLVWRAEEWAWSSVRERDEPRDILSPLPLALPRDWVDFVNTPLSDGTLSRIRRMTVPRAGRPLKDEHRML